MWLFVFVTICIVPVLRVAWRVFCNDGEPMAARRALAPITSPGRRLLMSETRRPRSSASDQRDALKSLLERMDQRQAAGFEEVHRAIGGLRDHLGRTDARVEGLTQDMQRELNHMDTRVGRMHEATQKDMADLRQALAEHEARTATDVARGAAEGAAEGVTKATAALSPDDKAAAIRKTLYVRLGNIGVFGLLLILAIKELPLLVRSVTSFFIWFGGLK